MREFKYRAWHTRFKIYATELVELGDVNAVFYFNDKVYAVPLKSSDLKIEQMFEFKDDNGKSVFEGDIVKIKNHSVYGNGTEKEDVYITDIVYYDGDFAMIDDKSYKIGNLEDGYYSYYPVSFLHNRLNKNRTPKTYIEVLGNINENIELYS